MNSMQRENLRRSRSEGPVADISQVERWNAVVYQSMYDKVSFQPPVWQCDHEHMDPHEAQRCADDHPVGYREAR